MSSPFQKIDDEPQGEAQLRKRIQWLEERIRQLEARSMYPHPGYMIPPVYPYDWNRIWCNA